MAPRRTPRDSGERGTHVDKRFGGVLAVIGLTATLLAGIGAVDAAPADGEVHARDAFASRGSYAIATAGTSAAPAARAGGLTAGIELRGDNGLLRDAVAAAGGVVTGEVDGVVHARVPQAQAAALEANPGVESMGPLPPLRPAEQSEGVALTGADAWLGEGTDGTGVDVAIVDIGFAGWSEQLGTELPASVATSFSSCAASDESEHGTAVAEIVHDMAPGATLHLVCVDDTYDLYPNSVALNYLAANDVEVAVASIGTFTASRGDGSSSLDRAINQSRRDGTLWVVAAGNAGDAHVRIPKGAPTQPRDVVDQPGYYIDAVDANTGATFDPFIRFRVPAGGVVAIDARWDAFPYTRIDFDLLAFTSAAVSNAGFVNGSFNDQLNQSLVPPIETFAFQNDAAVARDFYLAVDAYSPVSVPIDIFFVGAYNVEYLTAAGTVSDPGTGPGVLTVGAACAANGVIEPFSSRGPTTDGRVKPDLVGPDGTTSSIYGPASGCLGGFLGTSAATPHVGGAAALVLDADPDLGPTDVQGILERRATPGGVAGKDSTWGWGQLALGAADVPQAPQGDLFTGLSPSRRVLDTRTSATPLAGGSTRQIPIAGTNGVPADATAVVLSVVAVKPTAAGYLTAFPAGAARPVASSLNFAAGQVISNSVTVGLGPNGAVSLFNYAGSTNVVVDIAGWYGPSAATGLATVDPIRAVDTRPGRSTRIAVPGGDLGGAEVLTAKLAGNPLIPEVPASAVAVVLNAAVTAPTITGHLTVWPDGLAKPLASNLNFDKGATVANLVVAKTGTDGQVKVATNGGKAHVILDIVGYYDASAPGRFVALPTVNRVVDTRTGTGGPQRQANANQTTNVELTELYGVPRDALAAVLNVTAIKPESVGHLRVWGSGPLPTASTLNFRAGAIIGNAALVGFGPSAELGEGWFGVYTSSQGPTDLVADVSGYFISPL